MFTAEVTPPEKYIGLIIGKGGAKIKWIQNIFDVKVDLVEKKFIITSNSLPNLVKANNYINHIYMSKDVSSDTCAICLEYLDLNENYTMTPCGHKFHTSCLLKSLTTTQTCPLCRAPLTDKKTFSEEETQMVVTRVLANCKSNGSHSFVIRQLQDTAYPASAAIMDSMISESVKLALRLI